MDPEVKELLRRNAKLSEDNNALLHKMHRGAVVSRWFRLLYWAAIVIVAIVGYYYAEPYLQKVIDLYNAAQQEIQSVNSVKNSISNYLPKQ